MASRLNMIVLGAVIMVAAALFQSSEAQTTHIVGDSAGWAIPTGATTYTTWASKQTFAVGDILAFNFATGNHDVTKVTKAAFDGCTASNPISSPSTTTPTNITLNSAGEHYFICTFTGHCDAGQKLSVNVSAASTATPPSSTGTPPSITTTPPSSAPSLAAVSLPLALLYIVMAFLQ